MNRRTQKIARWFAYVWAAIAVAWALGYGIAVAQYCARLLETHR